MAVDPSADPNQLGEAIKMLLSWATGPGIIALICMVIGYRRRKRDEQQQNDGPPNNTLTFATLYADRMAIEQTASSVARLATAIEELTRELRFAVEEIRRCTK